MARTGGYTGHCYPRRTGGYTSCFPTDRPIGSLSLLRSIERETKIQKMIDNVVGKGSAIAEARLAEYLDGITDVSLPDFQRIDRLANNLFSDGYCLAAGINKFELVDSKKGTYGFLTLPRDRDDFKTLMKGSNLENYFLQLQYLKMLRSKFRRTYLLPPGEKEGFVYKVPRKPFNIVAEFHDAQPNLPLAITVVKSYSELKNLLPV